MKSKKINNYLVQFRSVNHLLLVLFIFLVGALSCKQSSKKEEESDTAKTEASKSPNLVAATDSVFVEKYVTEKQPAFKKHLDLMKLFYRDRNYRLAWFKNNNLLPQAKTLQEEINHAQLEALDPKDYQIINFKNLFNQYEQAKDDTEKARLQEEIDVALTATYFLYASDFYRGKVNPKKVANIDWSVKRNKIKLNKALETTLNERDSRYPYSKFEALQEGYTELREQLKKYRAIAQKGGWPKIEGVKTLKLNDSSDAVIQIRKRLAVTENPRPANLTSAIYDTDLEASVKSFQARHGLKPDGVIGPGTIKIMNIPVEERIDQIIINMERWRWIPKPKEMERKLIFVNIPEYTMHIKENGKEINQMKVIVGKTMNSTPVFSDKLEYIVFSPYWNVTDNILVNEVAPLQARKPNYMYSEEMEVVEDIGKNKVRIIPISSIDWANVTKENFKYRVRQRPGDKNPLGYVKFIFPNEYEVYLHDTPGDHLFNQTERGFSHGCVRIEKPFEFAQYLLKDQPQWTPEAIKSAMHSGEEKFVNLKDKVPVYIVYFTSWVDDNGVLNFRDDIYKHDQDLKKEYFK